ncbi:alpha/beta hydrolase family protein [Formosa sp. S-31]|uniref:alpha/beta hydrolase family protein n=1 Tax=Formosa sp. S-31 TaxID=2790949 RepID=UPI003EB87DD5
MKHFIIVSLALSSFFCVQAQKKEIDEAAYKSWKRIDKKGLSFNGEWMFYKTVFQDLEAQNVNEINIKSTKSDKEIVFKDVNEFQFVGTQDWVKYSKNDTIFLKSLNSGKQILWTIKDYTQAIVGTDYLTYTHYGPFENGKALKKVVYYNLRKNDSIVFNNIQNFSTLDKPDHILFSQEEQGKVFLKHGVVGGNYQTLYSCEASKFGDFTLNIKKNGGSFTVKKSATVEYANLLFYFDIKSGNVKEILDFETISLNDSLYTFTKQPYPIEEDIKIFPLQIQSNYNNHRPSQKTKKVEVEVWSWDEGTSQRRQEKLRGQSPTPKPPYYVYNVETKSCYKINLGDYEQVIAPNNNNYSKVFAASDKGYEVEVDWKFNSPHDLYFVNLEENIKVKVLENIIENPIWNTNGTYAVWFNTQDKFWMFFDVNDKNPEFKVIGNQMPYPLWNEENDFGGYTKAYGIAGWLNEGKEVVLYDKYDLWAVDLTGKKAPYCITKEYGRKNKVSLRLSGSLFGGDLSLNQDLLLKSFNTVSKTEGLCSLTKVRVNKLGGSPEYSVSLESISGDGSGYLFTKESYNRFPDLWYTKSNFSKEKQLTNINSQQRDYAWGKAQMIQWNTFKGTENEGILYLPENYNSDKIYPVIVHFYDKHTEELFKYHMPEVSTSNINIPEYVSKGYIVFQPDVHFTYNAPGLSAYNSVVSGVEYLIEKGIATKGHIGIQGHSFGGYETAFLLTKTDVFSCAIVGSGVSNFTSNYLSYRSNGLSNMFKYEVDQYRMKGSFFDNKDAYLENSPVFHAETVSTPTLIFHNDRDLAVPYQEGMSLFFALRRLHKPSWLINYKKEGHTLSDYENQKDWTQKMQSFFDFYLKDVNKPDWM